MPSYVIHLAVAKIYLSCHTEENEEEFIQGTIAPDLLEKPQSHYGEATSSPDLEQFKSARGLVTSYDRGYFLHLKTDLLFYQELITPKKISEEIYEDYNRMNRSLMQRYVLEIPEAVRKYVEFREGETVKLHEHMAVDFINTVGNLELEELAGDGEIPYRIGRNVFWMHENLDEYHLEENISIVGRWLEKAAERNHTKAMLLLAALHMWYRYGWEDVEMDCGEPYPLAHYTDAANTQAEKWLLKAAERNSAEAMYLLGELYKKPFGCSFDDSWYPGNVPEHWNKKTAEKWMKKAMENGSRFCEKTRKPEVIQEIIDDTKIMRYEDWDSYYQHIVLESAGEMIRKEEFVTHAMLIKHSYSDRKDLAKKAAGGDGKAGELLTKSYIPVIAGRLYKRCLGQWIPKAVIVNCINSLYEYKEKMDISHFDDQMHYKSRVGKIADDVCIRHLMDEKENETKRSDMGKSFRTGSHHTG